MAREAYSPRKSSPVNNVSKKAPAKKGSSTKGVALEVDKNTSAGVRKIENGYIVSESGMVGKGRNARWENKEYFSQTNPLAGIKTKVQFGKK